MATAGYSGTPLPKKLGIKEGTLLATAARSRRLRRHARRSCHQRRDCGPGADRVSTSSSPSTRQAVGARNASGRASPRRSTPNGTVWIAWPKKASKVATDITEDVLRELLLPTGWVDNKVCAIDDTWSGLRFALRRELR